MSEEDVRTAAPSPTPDIDPAAIALAMGRASSAEADAFLRDQRKLIADQRHHLHEQLRHLGLQFWQLRIGLFLRVATLMVGVAFLAAIGSMAWMAYQSNDLLIQPFSVPPELASRGLTGEAIAAKILDELVRMQAMTSSQRAIKTYVNSWDEKGIKLDIPESGISLAELDQFLREKLGHDTRMTGEVVRTPSSLSLTARVGVDGAETVRGTDQEMDDLIRRLAEAVYRVTQPYRYAVYLATHDRIAEAVPILKTLARSGTKEDRAWANNVLALEALDSDGLDASFRLWERAMAIDPDLLTTRSNFARLTSDRSRPEQALEYDKQLLAVLSNERQKSVRTEFIPVNREEEQAESLQQVGAFHEAALKRADVVESGLPGRYGLSANLARAQIGEHNLAAARATMADPASDAGLNPGMALLYKVWADLLTANAAEDWRAALSIARTADPLTLRYPGLRSVMPSTITPARTLAQASVGDFAAAEADIAATPADCYICLITRARIAELQGQRARADFWFSRAVHDAPSVPFAYANWGQSLLARGQADAAIEKFKLSSQKGLHFADPLVYWGEALMAKNQSHLALAKFQQAEPFAPNWGRLHLKWGEGLFYAGKKTEARKHFARAAQLDLTPTEKAELARFNRA